MDDPIDPNVLHSIPNVLGSMSEKDFEKMVKKVLDLFDNPEYVEGIKKLEQIISKQNPTLN